MPKKSNYSKRNFLFINLKCTKLNSYGLFNENQIKLNKNICILLINIHTFV